MADHYTALVRVVLSMGGREITEIANIVVKSATLEGVVEKATKHLALIDEE